MKTKIFYGQVFEQVEKSLNEFMEFEVDEVVSAEQSIFMAQANMPTQVIGKSTVIHVPILVITLIYKPMVNQLSSIANEGDESYPDLKVEESIN